MLASHHAMAALAALWNEARLPASALAFADLPGRAAVLPSSFNVTTAAQASLAAAALAAAEIWAMRTSERQRISVDAEHAVLESCGHFTVDGIAPEVWDKLSGLYPCGDAAGVPGWVRIHANFAHHRDGALRLLGCAPGPATGRAAVADALRHWRADEFETAAAQAGLVVAAARTFAQWDAHPQALALAGVPTVSIERIGDAPPRPWPAMGTRPRPLAGLRVLDLTRILAGPVAGRTLAAHGAEVMLVNSPGLPNIAAIADTSRGKLSAHADLKTDAGRDALRALLSDADVFLQAYRPGALQALGLGPQAVADLRPGLVVVSLSAYGAQGPWAGRRGFDSLVQTATGFNVAEAEAAGAKEPKAMPLQILDYAAGYLLAFGAQAALLRQRQEGGSWHVQVSLAGVGRWLRSLGRLPGGWDTRRPSYEPYLEATDSGFGRLVALRHAAQFSRTPAGWDRPAMPPGTHPPRWPSA
ncbi:CoA transferase [Piscinibacter terrae]|nr:CoA transferase [Albitalea terrae]